MITRASVLLLVVVLSSACGGDDDDDDGGGSTIDAGTGTLPDAGGEPDGASSSPDASGPVPDAGRIDAGAVDGGAGADASVDPDAGPGGMVIDSVVIDGSYSQVRQGSMFQIVILGSGLGGVTEVSFDDSLFPGAVVSTDTEVRVDSMRVRHGAPVGPRDVTLSGGDGSVTAVAAFEVTPWVIEVGAPPGGRATRESPMSLCDPELEFATQGDRVEISAGEHVCDVVLVGQAGEVLGQGVGVTVVRAPVFQVFGFDPILSTIGDLTLVAPGLAPGVVALGPGSVTFRDVVLEGLGVEATGEGGLITMERVTLDGRGADCFMTLQSKGLSMADTELSRCRNGIALPSGDALLVDVTITESEVGLLLGFSSQVPSQMPGASLTRVEMVDVGAGILQGRAQVGLTDVEIRGSSVAPGTAETGLTIFNGDTIVTRLLVTGMSRHGIELYPSGDPDEDERAFLVVTDSVIAGGEVGVDVAGIDRQVLSMLGTTVRDQTTAAVRIDGSDASSWSIRDSELSVVSGYALDDVPDRGARHRRGGAGVRDDAQRKLLRRSAHPGASGHRLRSSNRVRRRPGAVLGRPGIELGRGGGAVALDRQLERRRARHRLDRAAHLGPS